MIPIFNPNRDNFLQVEMKTETPELLNARLDLFYQDIRNIAISGMGSITSPDVEEFLTILNNAGKYDKTKIEQLLTLIEQAASAECFEKIEDAHICVKRITMYREEMGM